MSDPPHVAGPAVGAAAGARRPGAATIRDDARRLLDEAAGWSGGGFEDEDRAGTGGDVAGEDGSERGVADADEGEGAREVPAGATLADRLQRAAAGCAAGIGRTADPEDRRSLRGLVVRLHRQAQLVDELELQARAARITDCQRGLSRLRACTSTQALLGSVCEEVTRSCGLERVLLSRVEDGRWWPWVVNSAVEPEAWVASWRERSIPLDELTLETRLLREHRSELITDTSHRGIHEIIREGRSTSYVVAPIAPAGRVIGFFHADHRVGGRPCDATDRDVLWRFAEGFGHLFERTALSERLHGRRKEVDEMLDVVHDAMTQLTAVELRLSAGAEADDPAPAPDHPDVLDSLTPRERDVLRLLVAGRRNREIAEQLVISEATVKSHVKQLLRKHGVANRSQVIARHHGA